MGNYQETIQWLAVGACVLAALLFLGRTVYHRLKGSPEKGCGGCGGCGGQKTQAPHLTQLTIKKKLPSS